VANANRIRHLAEELDHSGLSVKVIRRQDGDTLRISASDKDANDDRGGWVESDCMDAD